MRQRLFFFSMILLCSNLLSQTPQPVLEKERPQTIEETVPEPYEERVEEVEIAPEPKVWTSKHTEGVHLYRYGKLEGLRDYSTNKNVLPAKYVGVAEKRPGVFVFANQEQIGGRRKYGVYDVAQRKIVIPAEYRELSVKEAVRENGEVGYVFRVVDSFSNSSSKGVYDSEYKLIVPVAYDAVKMVKGGIILQKDRLFGLQFLAEEHQGIPIIYEQLTATNTDSASTQSVHFIAKDAQTFNLFDNTGQLIYEDQQLIATFDGTWESRSKEHLVIKDEAGRSGIYDLSASKMIVPNLYQEIIDRSHGLYVVMKDDQYGIINAELETVVPFEYDAISFLEPTNLTYKNVEVSRQTLLSIGRNGKFGLMNREGKMISKINYDHVKHLNNFYALKKNGQFTIVDSSGKPINNKKYDDVGHFHEGRAAVFSNGLMGYLNTDGTMAEDFSRPIVPKGYETLDALYKDFVLILQSQDDDRLRAFTEAIVPDEYSIAFMQRTKLSYAGWPKALTREVRPVTFLIFHDEYFERFRQFRNRLVLSSALAGISFAGLIPLSGEVPNSDIFDEGFPVLKSEAKGLLQSEHLSFEFSMGELAKIDGYWKSFSWPRSQGKVPR